MCQDIKISMSSIEDPLIMKEENKNLAPKVYISTLKLLSEYEGKQDSQQQQRCRIAELRLSKKSTRIQCDENYEIPLNDVGK